MDLTKNIDSYDLVFIDLETTGLNPYGGDAICEVGAFKIKNREVIGEFQSLVNPKKNMPVEAYKVHKICDDDLRSAPYFEEIIDSFLSFLGNCVICAYNVGFDIGFLNEELNRISYPSLKNPAIDILSIARNTLKLAKYDLGTTAGYFNLDYQKNSHRAFSDACIAYKTFFNLRDMLKQRGLNNLGDYISLYGLISSQKV